MTAPKEFATVFCLTHNCDKNVCTDLHIKEAVEAFKQRAIDTLVTEHGEFLAADAIRKLETEGK